MDSADFIDSTTGSLVQTLERVAAFVPAPLPPSLDLAAIALPMATAMQAIGELRGACRRLQNPYILVRPLQRREALTSSAMEGTFTTEDQLLLAEAGVHPKDDQTREVHNYLRALAVSLRSLDKLPISHRVLKSAHEILLSGLSGTRGAHKRPGEYKREQNWIGGATIERARFVPPPPAETQTCMDRLEAYINREDRTCPNALMDLALVHYQIETIHPFADGNGRVGRMLISLMAVHSGLLDMPILYMSPILEKEKDRYIDLMFSVSTRGAWTQWFCFFFEKLSETCRSAVVTVDRLIQLHEEYRQKASGMARTSNILTLVDHLFENPFVTIGDVQKRLDVTYPAAKSTIDKLVQAGILREFQGSYPKLFVAPAIVRIADS